MDFTENDKTFEDFSSLEDAELERRFEEAETDSEAYHALMAELSKRGFDFVPADSQPEEPAEVSAPQKLRYSKAGSLAWAIVSFLISAGASTYILLQISKIGRINNSHISIIGLLALTAISLGLIVAGIRHLANQKGCRGENVSTSNIVYGILSFLWAFVVGGSLFYSVKNFIRIYRFGLEYAIYIALPTVVVALFGICFATAFFVLCVELKRG